MSAVDLELGARLQHLPEAVLLVREGRVARANAEAERLFGAPEAALVGRDLTSLVPPGDRPRVLARLDPARAPGAPLRLVVQGDDGRARPAEVAFAALPEGGIAVAARDVGAEVRAEQLLGHLAALPDEDGAPLSLLEASRPVFQALGWGIALLSVGEGSLEAIFAVAPSPGGPFEDLAAELRTRRLSFEETPAMARALAQGRPLHLEDLPAEERRHGGIGAAHAEALEDARLLHGAFFPLPGAPVAHLLAVVGRDLSDWDFVTLELFAGRVAGALRAQTLRRELLRSERLAATGEVAGDLAASVRRSLEAIRGSSRDLARRDLGTGEARLLAMVDEETSRLARLADALAGFAEPAPAHPEPLVLRDVAEAAVAFVRSDPAAGRPGEIRIETPAELPAVLADAHLLQHALVNLLVNALQHVPEGGSVRIRGRVEAGAVRVQVQNSGPPIAPDIAPRIFEPFFTTKATGTGLGLAIVRRIVEDLGGRVALDADEAEVSFSLWLPLAGAEEVR